MREIYSKLNEEKGIASIPMALSLMMLVIVVSVMIASLSASERLATDNNSDSSQAVFYAQIGARDALERIARNKNYSGSYTIDVVPGGCSAPFAGCATVSVDSGSNPKIASSTGQVDSVYRRVQVNVTLDANGLITGHSWQEQ